MLESRVSHMTGHLRILSIRFNEVNATEVGLNCVMLKLTLTMLTHAQ